MPDQSSSRISLGAAALLLLVTSVILTPLGMFAFSVVAQVMGGNNPPQVLVSPDPLSDSVAATAAEFRVDESGAATYKVALYTVPGTAGVKPEISLAYSSQAGYGPVGRGWSIGGLSSIARCRATREAGDFLGAATPDGSPRPINFSSTDRFCLDGQRLVPSSANCPSHGGVSGSALATEIDTFTRVCAYTAGGTTAGPAFFTVERKDGSLSWYGDRDSGGGSNRPDGYFETTSPLNPGAALIWAQTRFQDSTGNHIDYLYSENPAGPGTGEHLISEIRYTGKVALPGQSGTTVVPYARVVFNYTARPELDWGRSYAAGGVYTHSRRLESITSCGTIGCGASEQVRHYLLTYQPAYSGNRQDNLIGLQECRDSTAAVCAAPTAFAWSNGRHELATVEQPADLPFGNIDLLKGFKLGDVDGDGRMDMVHLRQGICGRPPIPCDQDAMAVSLGGLDAQGRTTFTKTQEFSLGFFLHTRGDGGWHLLDYDGDGRDDLFVSGPDGQGWRVFRSLGGDSATIIDLSQNLIAGLSPAIPSYPGTNDQVQLADLNGDGLTDIVYPRDGAMLSRLMERQGAGWGWGGERVVAINEASLGSLNPECDDASGNVSCTRTIAGVPTPKTGFLQVADFNGDAASDLLIRVNTRIERYLGGPGCNQLAQSRGASTAEVGQGASSYRILPYALESNPEELSQEVGTNAACLQIRNTSVLHAFSVEELGSNGVGLANYGSIAGGFPNSLSLADINGDGLTDVFTQSTDGGDWFYRLNRGNGFDNGVSLQINNFHNQTRFADVNGDGRADVLTVVDIGSYKTYYARLAIPSGGFYASPMPIDGGNARICEGNGCDERQKVPMFADLDGDGNLDFMSIRMVERPDVYLSRANQRFVPRDVITQITNGLGAVTEIRYSPMTLASAYRRDAGARNGLNWGRGAPISDLMMPNYVVTQAASSSAEGGSDIARARVHYRYAGAKVQAGGRGFLGFREITTIDGNQTGGHVVTTTSYAQNFPFIGVPVQTTKKAVLGQAYLVPSCLNGVISNGCFTTPGNPHPDLGGSWISDSVQSWEMAPASLATQTPIHVRTQGTEESLRDPYTGEQTSKVATAFSYGSHGNVTQTVVDTYTGTTTFQYNALGELLAQTDNGGYRTEREIDARGRAWRVPGSEAAVPRADWQDRGDLQRQYRLQPGQGSLRLGCGRQLGLAPEGRPIPGRLHL